MAPWSSNYAATQSGDPLKEPRGRCIQIWLKEEEEKESTRNILCLKENYGANADWD